MVYGPLPPASSPAQASGSFAGNAGTDCGNAPFSHERQYRPKDGLSLALAHGQGT